MELMSNKKKITDENVNIGDLQTCDSGEDNLLKLDKVIADFEIEPLDVKSLTPDGAKQNIGSKLGGCTLVCYFV